MAEQNNNIFAPLNYLIDSFWASLPEETANDLATFKKDVLSGVKNVVDGLVEQEIKWTDRHLDNAHKMREQYKGSTTEPDANAAESSPL
jgi:hypothetical protein